MLGDTPYQPSPRDSRFNDPTWSQNPFYRRSLQAYLAWQKQTRLWIEDSHLTDDDRARAHFLFNLLNDALAPSRWVLCSPITGNKMQPIDASPAPCSPYPCVQVPLRG